MTEEDVKNMQARIARGKSSSVIGEVVGIKAKGSTTPRDRSMNKTEVAYAAHLERERLAGRIHAYKYESVKLRLADNTTLTMDFMVIDCDGFVHFHDTKGVWGKNNTPHVEDDYSVKVKVAAEQYPFWTFKTVWFFNNTWHEREH